MEPLQERHAAHFLHSSVSTIRHLESLRDRKESREGQEARVPESQRVPGTGPSGEVIPAWVEGVPCEGCPDDKVTLGRFRFQRGDALGGCASFERLEEHVAVVRFERMLGQGI
eukprot:CAMPEP_0185761946 /NCGR_PEP_ID=MMETSP1174-20130828/20897_1 /TAXON_ID=35687 /ORGANISM="Dictyocha speculum, Strain CCMP1381" /LENGTH=112 /DNA_ID=CAMNT_0028443397 /DNA_START=467 /DNA_END=805 /DNA_ORIENTATION=-